MIMAPAPRPFRGMISSDWNECLAPTGPFDVQPAGSVEPAPAGSVMPAPAGAVEVTSGGIVNIRL